MNEFKILDKVHGKYVRFAEIKDGKTLRRVAISRLKEGRHLVDVELPGQEMTPMLMDHTSEQVTTMTSSFDVVVNGVRTAICDVLRENDIFKEEDQVH